MKTTSYNTNKTINKYNPIRNTIWPLLSDIKLPIGGQGYGV